MSAHRRGSAFARNPPVRSRLDLRRWSWLCTPNASSCGVPHVTGEIIPEEIVSFLAAQLGLRDEDLGDYAVREETRHEHMAILRETYGYKTYTGRRARDLKTWLDLQAELTTSNEDIARRFVVECRRTQTILPAITTVERLCANALVAAERRVETRIAQRLSDDLCGHLDALLSEHIDDRLTRFVRLRQFKVGNNSAGANRLLDRREFLHGIELPPDLTDGVPEHRVTRLRRQGERYFADGLRADFFTGRKGKLVEVRLLMGFDHVVLLRGHRAIQT